MKNKLNKVLLLNIVLETRTNLLLLIHFHPWILSCSVHFPWYYYSTAKMATNIYPIFALPSLVHPLRPTMCISAICIFYTNKENLILDLYWNGCPYIWGALMSGIQEQPSSRQIHCDTRWSKLLHKIYDLICNCPLTLYLYLQLLSSSPFFRWDCPLFLINTSCLPALLAQLQLYNLLRPSTPGISTRLWGWCEVENHWTLLQATHVVEELSNNFL